MVKFLARLILLLDADSTLDVHKRTRCAAKKNLNSKSLRKVDSWLATSMIEDLTFVPLAEWL
jgi:hypothetical protein